MDVSVIETAIAKVSAEIDAKLKANAKATATERRALEAKLDEVSHNVQRQLQTNGEIAVRIEESTVSAVKALLDARVPSAPQPTFERRKRS